MPFSRKTILRAVEVLGTGNPAIDALELEFDIGAPGYSIRDRVNSMAQFLIGSPDRVFDGENTVNAIVDRAVSKLVSDARGFNERGDLVREDQIWENPIWKALKRDGYTLDDDGQLQPMLPAPLDLPRADDEVHSLLDMYRFTTSRGHLDEAIQCHSQGTWAATNGQTRTFLESLLDEIAIHLNPETAMLASSENRRQALANLNPPFLQPGLNEWSDDGKNFTNGVFKRLHANGPHPGLSDEEDCTFRLHLVSLVARLYLRRLGDYVAR